MKILTNDFIVAPDQDIIQHTVWEQSWDSLSNEIWNKIFWGNIVYIIAAVNANE